MARVRICRVCQTLQLDRTCWLCGREVGEATMQDRKDVYGVTNTGGVPLTPAFDDAPTWVKHDPLLPITLEEALGAPFPQLADRLT